MCAISPCEAQVLSYVICERDQVLEFIVKEVCGRAFNDTWLFLDSVVIDDIHLSFNEEELDLRLNLLFDAVFIQVEHDLPGLVEV